MPRMVENARRCFSFDSRKFQSIEENKIKRKCIFFSAVPFFVSTPSPVCPFFYISFVSAFVRSTTLHRLEKDEFVAFGPKRQRWHEMRINRLKEHQAFGIWRKRDMHVLDKGRPQVALWKIRIASKQLDHLNICELSRVTCVTCQCHGCHSHWLCNGPTENSINFVRSIWPLNGRGEETKNPLNSFSQCTGAWMLTRNELKCNRICGFSFVFSRHHLNCGQQY